MKNAYTSGKRLEKDMGNNALAYEKRTQKYLTVPSMVEGTFDDVQEGSEIVFEEADELGMLVSCTGLQYFIRMQHRNIPISIFDNHNHALAFWYEAYLDGTIDANATLIHIDEHSDLWDNLYDIGIVKNPDFASLSRDDQDMHIYQFTNEYCNVGNYIQPAIRDGLIGEMIRIENEYQLDEYINYRPSGNTILNIDLDFFAPEMDFIDRSKKIHCIRKLLPRVQAITIATSPYFIDFKIAISHLNEILNHE